MADPVPRAAAVAVIFVKTDHKWPSNNQLSQEKATSQKLKLNSKSSPWSKNYLHLFSSRVSPGANVI
jgi:hypothetical protein